MGSSFKVLPDAGPVGEQGAQGRESLALGEAPAAPWPLPHKECAVGRNVFSVELFGPGIISKTLFPLRSQTYFSKQVLLISWNVGILYGVSHIHFFKLCLKAQLPGSEVLCFRRVEAWKARGSFRSFIACASMEAPDHCPAVARMNRKQPVLDHPQDSFLVNSGTRSKTCK